VTAARLRDGQHGISVIQAPESVKKLRAAAVNIPPNDSAVLPPAQQRGVLRRAANRMANDAALIPLPARPPCPIVAIPA